MKTLTEELQDITKKARNKKELVKKEVTKNKKQPVISAKKRAETLLISLPKILKISANRKYTGYGVLKIEDQKNQTLNYYENLVFKGCKKLGLDTKISELYDGDMTSRWSIGYHIYISWEK